MKTENVMPADSAGILIRPTIFGSFIEHIENCIAGGICDPGNSLSDEKGIRQDVLRECQALGPSVLRFPGGTVMGIYHWQDFVGPVENRKKVKNIVWGGKLPREFGTCEYVDFCRKVGAEPMICVNMPTGTPEEAAHWVEYCNGTEDTYYANLRRADGYEEPFNVKYWCIGNESYAEPDLGMQEDVHRYVREAWEYVKYMKMTDPTIELVFCGNDEAWNREVLASLAPVCDYLSLHFYGMGDDPFGQIAEFEKKLIEAETLIREHNAADAPMNRWYRIPGRAHEIRIAVDEWNIWDPEPTEASPYGLQQKYTWKDALWVAEFMNLLIRHSETVGMANLAQLVNVIAPIMTVKDGCYRQTIFYPFKLYRKYCGDTFYPLQTENSAVDMVLTGKNGKRILFTVNRSEEYVRLELPFKAEMCITLICDDLCTANSMKKDLVKECSDSSVRNAEFIQLPYSICMISDSV